MRLIRPIKYGRRLRGSRRSWNTCSAHRACMHAAAGEACGRYTVGQPTLRDPRPHSGGGCTHARASRAAMCRKNSTARWFESSGFPRFFHAMPNGAARAAAHCVLQHCAHKTLAMLKGAAFRYDMARHRPHHQRPAETLPLRCAACTACHAHAHTFSCSFSGLSCPLGRATCSGG